MLTFLVCLLPIVASVPVETTSENYILDIDNNTLKNVRLVGDPGSVLNLSNRNLHALEKNAFDNVPDVESLDLSNNSLNTLPEFIFCNLTRLKSLSLANNQISKLRNFFVGLENLQLLDISNNPIRHLARSDLFGLAKSVRILTDGNIFWSISTDVFTKRPLEEEELASIAEHANTANEGERETDAEDKGEEIDDTESENTESSAALDKNTRVKLCKSDGVVTSLDIFQKNEELAEGCVQVSIDAGRQVNLRDRGITGFREGWYRLRSLPIASLILSNNSIVEIEGETLNDLPAGLTYVNLAGNQIRKIRSQVIENDHLRELNFERNSIEEIEENAFAKTKLRGLYFPENQLKSLNFVSTLPNTLTKFIASENRIASIPDDAFSGLSRLLYLNLEKNKIAVLQNDVFQNLKSLQALTLAKNDIATIGPAAFKGLTALRTLELQRNSIHDLQTGTFAALTVLKVLDLTSNKIAKATFADLPRTVGMLHLDLNEIEALEKDSFVESPRVVLTLAGNRISTIARGAFNLPTLKELYLNKNILTTIEGDSYEGLSHLRRLSLSENKISEIRKGSCKNLGSLYVLNISSNPFQKLEAGALHGISTAVGRSLFIYKNNLKEMQTGLFDDI